MKRILMTLALVVTGLLHAEVKPYSVVEDDFCGRSKGAEAFEVCLSNRPAYINVTLAGRSKQFAPITKESAILGAVGGRVYSGKIVLPHHRGYELERAFTLTIQGGKVTLTLTHRDVRGAAVTENFTVEGWESMMHTM